MTTPSRDEPVESQRVDHRAIDDLARRQHGAISRGQALERGATRRTIQSKVTTGQWHREFEGVYVVGAAPNTWKLRAMAACLAAGPDVRASHRTAIRIHDFVDRTGRLELLTDGYRRVRLPGVLTHGTKHLVAEDTVIVDGIPVTSVERSLIDVGGRQSEATLGRWIDRALMGGTVDLARLIRRATELTMPGRERPTALLRAISLRSVGHDPGRSVFEARVIEALARREMPSLVRQLEVRRTDGRRAFIDLADPSSMTAVELDGWATHGIREAFEPDRIRGNELQLLGWNLLRFSWHMTDDYICDTIAAAIHRPKTAIRS